jgi:hypothetical protein
MVKRSTIINGGEVYERVVCEEANVCCDVCGAAGTRGNHTVM